MLGGGHFVVLGLGHYAQFPQFLVQFFHVGPHPGLNRTKVVVIQLLPLGRHRPKKGAAGIAQVAPPLVQLLRDQEILLLRPYGGGYGGDIVPAHGVQKAHRFAVENVHTAQQRRFFIQCFAGIAAKGGGDIQAVIFDERRTGRIPGGIAPRLKGGAQPAAGEAAGIRFALDEFPPGKFHNDPIAGRGQEAIVLFGGDAGHRLEPVGKVGYAMIQCPGLHHIGDDIGYGSVQRLPTGYDLPQTAVGIVGQALLLHCVIKDKAAEQFRNIAHPKSLPCGGKAAPSPKKYVTNFITLHR